MTERARKTPMTLEVHVLFEPNRLEQRLLHTAYATLLPGSRRCLRMAQRTPEVPAEKWDQAAERKTP